MNKDPLSQRSLTFLAAGTGFLEDRFSTDRWRWGWFSDGEQMKLCSLAAHLLLCSLIPNRLRTPALSRYSDFHLTVNLTLCLILLPENWVCLLVNVTPKDTAKPKVGRRKALLLAASKENTRDLSQSSVSSNSKIGEVLS